jgi:hypothetical protein
LADSVKGLAADRALPASTAAAVASLLPSYNSRAILRVASRLWVCSDYSALNKYLVRLCDLVRDSMAAVKLPL